MNTKPVLLRAQIPEWGTVHEVVARVEMAGSGFERTMVKTMHMFCCDVQSKATHSNTRYVMFCTKGTQSAQTQEFYHLWRSAIVGPTFH